MFPIRKIRDQPPPLPPRKVKMMYFRYRRGCIHAVTHKQKGILIITANKENQDRFTKKLLNITLFLGL